MAIQTGSKGATILGVGYPPYQYIDWLTPDQEGLAIQGGDAFVVPSRGLSPAQAAAVSAGLFGRQNTEAWCMSDGPPFSNNGVTTATWQLVFATRAPAYAVRVAYINGNTGGAVTYDATTISTSAALALTGDPSGGQSYTPVTWAGSASITVAAAPSATLHTVSAWSDWITIAPAVWSGVTNGRSLQHLRSYSAAGGGSYINNVGQASYAGNVAGGLVRNGGFVSTGDKTASTMTATNPTYFLPVILEFREIGRTYRMLTVGDSQTVGNTGGGSIGAFGLACWPELTVNLLNERANGTIWSAYNFGRGSMTYATFDAQLAAALAVISPDFVALPCASPNSVLANQAQLDANTANLLSMVWRTRNAGALPIIWSTPPRNSYTATHEANRLSANAIGAQVAASFGVPFVDIAAATGGASDGTRILWPAAYSSDGLHPNDTALAVWAGTFAAKLSQL